MRKGSFGAALGVVLAVASVLIGSTACTLLTSVGDLVIATVESDVDSGVGTDRDPDLGRREELADSGAVDAANVDRVEDNDAAGPPGLTNLLNLHPEGTFETGCSRWRGNATHAASTTARTGSASCLVCANANAPPAPFFSIDDLGLSGPATPGATYRAGGWARLAPGTIGPGPVALTLRNLSSDGKNLESLSSADTRLSTEWQRFESTLSITKSGGKVDVYIAADYVPGACFLLDDVVVERVD